MAQRDRLHDLIVDHDVVGDKRGNTRHNEQARKPVSQHAPQQRTYRVVALLAVLAKLRTH